MSFARSFDFRKEKSLAEKKSKGKNTINIVKELSIPIAEEFGLGIWDIAFYKEGPDWNLKVILDSEAGIGFDECEKFSRILDKKLDEIDPIEQSYTLEVSSPGLGRKLTQESHFKRFINEKIKIRFIRARDGQKEITGILKSYGDDIIKIEIETDIIEVNKKETAFVKLCDDENLF